MAEPKTIAEQLRIYRIYLAPALVGLVVFALLVVVVKPKILDILAVRSEISDLRVKLGNLTQKLATLENLDKKDLKERFLVTNEALPSEQDVAGFLAGMERLAAESGVLVEKVELSPETVASASASYFHSRAILKGRLENIKDFLAKMSFSRRVLRVKTVSLSASSQEIATPSMVMATLSINVFFEPLPAFLGEADEPLPALSQKDKEIFEEIANFSFVSQPLPVGETGFLASPSARLDPFAQR